MTDVRIHSDGATATATGETDAGEEFVDAWAFGVLSVEDYGRVVVTSEIVDELAREARVRGLDVEATP